MTTKADILAAIRRKCLECCCQQPSEVRQCHITACDLWAFRFGNDPSPGPARGCAKSPVPRDGRDNGTGLPLSGTGPIPLPEISSLGRESFERDEPFRQDRSR